MSNEDDRDDTPPGLPSPWLRDNRAHDSAFIREGVARLQAAYVASLERFVDEVLGLPDPGLDRAGYAAALEDPAVRRLRATSALRLTSLLPFQVERDFVVAARRAGASWTEIGDASDVSRQAARQRWGHLDVPRGPAPKAPTARDLLGDVRPQDDPEGPATT